MQKEIGGYIEFERYDGKQYHEDALKLNCARNCLAYLIAVYRIQKIYLPYFLCDSVWKVCKKYGVQVSFYHIDENFRPILPNADFEKDWLYVVNYYGQVSNQEIAFISQSVKNLIVDNVQSFFQKPVQGLPTIYTCRKFFGVADGAYLYTDKTVSGELERDISFERMEHLLGRFERSASEFYPAFAENEKIFEALPVKRMGALTENLMRSFDYERIAKRRAENFRFLHENLQNVNKLNLTVPYGAYMYPLLLENGSEIRKHLQEQKIYIPTLWGDVFEVCRKGSLEYNYAENILPLPVDQRYGEEEMKLIITYLKN
ncbi:MAG: hypothetical protein IJ158_01380 [Treponema sp.]|nr:hypothetical protein [Treponema sp.]